MSKIQYFVRPECGHDDRLGPVLGPFDDFLQLTYTDLRVGPDGEPIAGYRNGWWGFSPTYRPQNQEVPLPVSEPVDFPWHELLWSDVVIWAKLA